MAGGSVGTQASQQRKDGCIIRPTSSADKKRFASTERIQRTRAKTKDWGGVWHSQTTVAQT